ncbi:hypothetical protein NL676_035500 [Syzygium grande]|nr:hypothetical protein NL676_035500 [Syzygium grande]
MAFADGSSSRQSLIPSFLHASSSSSSSSKSLYLEKMLGPAPGPSPVPGRGLERLPDPGAQGAVEEDRDVLAGVLRHLHLRRHPQLRPLSDINRARHWEQRRGGSPSGGSRGRGKR